MGYYDNQVEAWEKLKNGMDSILKRGENDE